MRRGIGLPQPLDLKSTTEIRSAAKGARASRRVLTGRPGDVSDIGGGRTDRAGPAPGGVGADRQARAPGARARSGIPRSRPCDQDWTRKIRPRG